MPLPYLPAKDFKHHSRRLGVLMLPILITQFRQAALGVVDSIMAGRVSALDLAAVSIGTGIWLPLFLLSSGILLATTPLIGEKIGQDRLSDVPMLTQQSLWAGLGIGVIGAMLVTASPALFGLMGVPADIAPIASDYVQAVAWGFPAIAVYAVLRCYCEALSRPEPVTAISIIGLLADIPLNYVFIYGKLGMPAMGGAGCGVASAIVMWLNCLLLIGYLFFSQHRIFRQTRFFGRFAPPSLPHIKTLLALGLPIGVSIFFEASLFSLASLVISPLGEIAVASHQVASAVTSQIFMIPVSLAMALTIMISNRFGEKNWAQLIAVQRTGLAWAVIIALISMVLTAIFRQELAAAFTDNIEVMQKAMLLLLFAIAYQLVDGWQVTIAGILRGMQDTTVPMLLTLFCYWGVALPLGTYLVRYTDTGAKGFWLALVTGLTLAAILLTARLIYFERKRGIHPSNPHLS